MNSDRSVDRGSFFHHWTVCNVIFSPIQKVIGTEFDPVEIIVQGNEFQILRIIKGKQTQIPAFFRQNRFKIPVIEHGEFSGKKEECRGNLADFPEIFHQYPGCRFLFFLFDNINSAFRIQIMHFSGKSLEPFQAGRVSFRTMNRYMAVPVVV